MKHIEAVQKDLTSVCFDACFNTKKFKVSDEDCVLNCYQKYVFALNFFQKKLTDRGRTLKSDYVCAAVG